MTEAHFFETSATRCVEWLRWVVKEHWIFLLAAIPDLKIPPMVPSQQRALNFRKLT
ncbi:hypothetical protein AWB81_06205 [Caballeronia arationis]|nr:hypothetical protein AWB81_06205 [Caballeronia arationis]